LSSLPRVSRQFVFFILILGFLFIILAFFVELLTFGFVRMGWLYAIGVLTIISALFLGLMPDGILRRDQVLDSWSILIEKGNGRCDEIFRDFGNFVKESKAPKVNFEKKSIAPSFLKWIIGVERDFIEVREEIPSLRAYKIFVGARDFGENLDVSWYLTYKPSLLDALIYLLTLGWFGMKKLDDLDLFEIQDLTAYATCVHHCLLKSVEKVLLSLNQDPSKISRKSRGFLGVS
jgi:hypothetical protein